MIEDSVTHPILVVGGGIGGLSAALVLARRGWPVEILERTKIFSEAGAGIQLGPNATRILQRWGLDEPMRAVVSCPQEVRVRNLRTGEVLGNVPLGDTAASRYGAPYWVVHRQDLQAVLLEAIGAEPRISIQQGFAATDLDQDAGGAMVLSSDGKSAAGSAVIAADGVWSNMRAEMGIAPQPKPVGRCAWRAVIPIEDVPAELAATSHIGLWLAPGAHVVHYPVKAGKALNLVVIVEDEWRGEGWGHTGDGAVLLETLPDMHEDVRRLVELPESWGKWALFTLPPLRSWVKGRCALLGDAAHAMVPFYAQGGAMAIEDADALASALGMPKSGIKVALNAYQLARQERTDRVQRHSLRLGRIYHMGKITATARDLVLRARSGGDLLHDQDWVYAYGAETS